jgi:inner membrane protein
MDPFTHALSGAAVSRAFSRKQPAEGRFTARERLLLGAAAALFPDSDWIIRLFADELVYLNLHRGVTHSILMLPFWALLLGWLVARFWPRPRDWREAAVIVALGIGIHILGDFITNYGTQLFAPFSAYPLAFPSTFIIDPWMTTFLLAGVALAWFQGRRLPARIGLGLAVGLVLFQGIMKLQALNVGEAEAEARGLHAAPVHAMPQPASPLHWRVILETESGYLEAHLGFLRQAGDRDEAVNPVRRHWQTFQPPHALQWRSYSRFGEDAFAGEAWQREEFRGFREFAAMPYLWALQEHDGKRCAVFTDLRFRVEGMERSPFRFAMCRDESGAWYRKRIGPW